jgi:hypothetical protein
MKKLLGTACALFYFVFIGNSQDLHIGAEKIKQLDSLFKTFF